MENIALFAFFLWGNLLLNSFNSGSRPMGERWPGQLGFGDTTIRHIDNFSSFFVVVGGGRGESATIFQNSGSRPVGEGVGETTRPTLIEITLA